MSEPPPDPYDAPKPPPATTFEWTPDLASGRVPGAEVPVEPIHPVRLTVIWLLGVMAVLLIATITVGLRGTGSDDAFERGRDAGRLVGTALAPILIAFVLWGIRVAFAPRGSRRRLLLSPIVPSLAVLLALFAMVGAGRPASGSGATATSTGSPVALQTLAEALAIRAPYVAQEPDAAERGALIAQMGDLSSFKSVNVRRILDGDAFVAYAVVGETDLKPGAEALAIGAIEMAFAEQRSANPDWKESRTEVSGRTVVRITAGAEGAVAIWAEPPYVKLVIAYTGTTLDSVLASFVNP